MSVTSDPGALPPASDPPASPTASDAGASSPPSDSGERRPSQVRMIWQRILVALPVLVLAGFAVVVTAVPAIQVSKLSVLDEAAHIDSVFKVPAIDRSGEKFLPRTLDEISCRGGIVQMPDFHPPGCGIPQGVPADDYQVGSGGYNTADIHPPTYYFVTAGLTKGLGIFVDTDPVTLMRLTGSLYLAIGACLTWLLARRLGANRWAAFGASGLLIAAPNVQYMSSIVNVDASVVMASAAFGLLALAVWRRRSAWWLLPLLAVGLMLVKMTNIGALIVVALFVVLAEATGPIRTATDDTVEPQRSSPAAVITRWRRSTALWSQHNGRATVRALGLAALMAVGAAVVTVGWATIQSQRALIPATDLWFTQQFKVDHLALTQIGDSLLRFWDPTSMWFGWLSGRPYMGSVLLVITAAVPFGLMIAAWFRDRSVFPMLAASLATMAIAAPVYVLTNYLVNGIYFNPDFRYGLSILPLFAAAVAAGLRTRIAGGVLSAVAVLGMVTTLITLSW